MALALDEDVCCLSCYLCYIEKFLTLDEIGNARAISFDCRCEFGDLPAPTRSPPQQPQPESQPENLGQDVSETSPASPMEQ